MNTQTLADLLHSRDMRLVDLSRALGVNKATVTRWSQSEVPHNRVQDVSRVTGIPPHELRPDLADIFLPRSKQGERA